MMEQADGAISGLRVIMTGGGTGGHVYPALAVAAGLRAAGAGKILFIGSSRGMESEVVKREGWPFRGLPADYFRGRYPTPDNLRTAVNMVRSTLAGARELRRFRPRVVVATGGYASVPVALAAVMARIPLVVLEQDALPGRANRFLSRFARAVCTAYAESIPYFARPGQVKCTGNPVRREVLEAGRKEGRLKLGIPPEDVLVLGLGGSGGARTINEAMAEALSFFESRPNVRLLHVTGPRYFESFRQAVSGRGWDKLPANVEAVDYLHLVPEALAAADVIVCRAGAVTLAEVTCRGLPAIVVPSPNVAGDHQAHNARALGTAGAAVVVKDVELDGRRLVEELTRLVDDPETRKEMSRRSLGLSRPGATGDIVNTILETADL
ncbi:MAG: undecaprenyldiphospho-muramoylpentapeptide beta-N-acetylglucosaminyltransferase [Firmicutes bacterium]|nr:undecaprenyldiphospho-muramoylpentapeptide beta-N-acetylglucosaminyltransferase [Bacillota bacterium]